MNHMAQSEPKHEEYGGISRIGIKFFDAHTHLQEPEIMWDIEGIIERWHMNGGSEIICCGTKESDWGNTALISEKYSEVKPCFGVHPWFVDQISEKWFYELDGYLDSSFSGVSPFMGEIGLDHVLKGIDRELQERVFRTQLGMAIERKIPVVIHVRKGWDTLLRVLKYTGTLEYGGMVHSYSGSADIVPLLEKYGLYISFSGSVTQPSNRKVKKALLEVSSERLLIETDSPAILPRYPDPVSPESKLLSDGLNRFTVPSGLYETGWNEPANIFLVALAVAEVRGITLSEAASITFTNGKRLFGSTYSG